MHYFNKSVNFAACVFVVIGSLLCGTTRVRADAQGNMVRALTAKYGAGIVTLQLVLKSAAGGEQAQLETDGIVLDANGLIATTNTAIDPTSAYSSMMGEEETQGMATSVVSIKIRLSSGEELPGRVVLRDKDRNLAFVRPLRRPTRPFVAVNFKGTHIAKMGDMVYLLGRMGKAGNRQNESKIERVTGVVEKPRRLYVLDTGTYSYLGNVVFNESGQPLGILSVRIVRSGRANLGASGTILVVVIPAADVWEVALQAPQAKDVRQPRAQPKTTPKKPSANR